MYTTPTVAGDLVYVGSCNGSFWAFDLKNGEGVWVYDYRVEWGEPCNFHGDPLVTDSLIITGTDGVSIGHMIALDRATGEVRWMVSDERGFATDLVRHGPNLYAANMNDEFFCIDIATGAIVWEFAAEAPLDSIRWSGSPVVIGDRVFFGPRDGRLYALSTDSGTVIWERDFKSPITTTIHADGDRLIVGTDDGMLRAIDARTGTTRFELQLGMSPRWKPVQIESALALLVDDAHGMLAVDDSLSGVNWHYAAGNELSAFRPHAWNGTILIGDSEGRLQALDPVDGSVQWEYTVQGTVRGIGSGAELLFVGTLQGTIYALRHR